ncbi:serpin H1a [Corythoichthys intestinalis]|uniref:serpin H1a n=1 Tax=Corythoichthys intestinalis TaxID=161448 RepID=UPI0025A544CC|nr:serpin H1a [Corythoichthys intestinalis]XP_061801480.1 serpin H1-like [Nerophis lumbriciformis]
MWLNVIAVAFLATSASAATAASPDKVLSKHATTMADNSANLAFNLYQHMAKEKNVENILVSPVVVASSLGLMALGGKASTASQVKTVLNAAKVPDEQLHSGLAELLTEVSDPKTRNVTWQMSNRLYGPSSVNFVDAFVKSSKKHYDCDAAKINFKDKKSALNSINEWAAKSTDGKVPEVTKDIAKSDGAMIINAMFFKPHWDEEFHHKMVDNRGFMVSHSYTVSIEMMHRTGIYGFYEDKTNKVTILSMPLALKKSSLVFIMPNQVDSLDGVEKMLTKKQLDSWMSKLQQTAVAVSLPKVSMEVSHNLEKHLEKLGLTEVVNKSKADLSKISGKKDLYLSSVFHAATIELATEGNEMDTSIFNTDKLKSPKLFYADHPFIFLVKDQKTNSILFIGRLVRPKGEKMRDEL